MICATLPSCIDYIIYCVLRFLVPPAKSGGDCCVLDNVKYIIEPYCMVASVKNSRAVTRPYAKNLGMQHVFEHVRKVTEVAYIIADNTGKNTYDVSTMIYRTMRGPDPKYVHL